MIEKETIFREGDKVYHHNRGCGEVTAITSTLISINFLRVGMVAMSKDVANEFLSFTEYKLAKEGFSQERPMPTISMPYLSNKWKYIAKDRIGVYIYHNKPKWSAKLGYFVHQIGGHAKVNSIICASSINAEFNTIYKIIDNDQST